MERIDKILANNTFAECMAKINKSEQDRKFCLHNMEHSLDVARISYIICLEEKVAIKKDVVYAAALLHDIGRAKEYESGISHHEASAILAREILETSDYSVEETDMICDAIIKHKSKASDELNLNNILYKADKLSRACYSCAAYDECYWDENIKTKTIEM